MLSIGKAVVSLLTANAALLQLLPGSHIFPLVIPEGDENGNELNYPVLVYNRDSVTPEYSKEGLEGAGVTVSTTIITEGYAQGVDIADEVVKALNLKSGTVAGLNINRIRLKSAIETFESGAFVQHLVFEFIIHS